MKTKNPLVAAVAATILFTLSSNELISQWNPTWYPGGFNAQTLFGGPNIPAAAPWAVGGNQIQSAQPIGSWNNYTCGTDDGAPFALMANGVPFVYMSGSQVAIGAYHTPSAPNCLVDMKGLGSNFRIYGDASGKLESTTDLNVNYGANINSFGGIYFNQGGYPNTTTIPRFQIDPAGNGRFFRALQVDNQVTVGSFGFTPPLNTKIVANAQNSNEAGLLVYADKGNNALYVANSAGANRFRMWVNSGGGDDSKMHMAGSAQFGFYTSANMVDNTTRLNVDAGGMNGLKVSTGSANSTYKAFYLENNSGSTITNPFVVFENGITHIGVQTVPSRSGSLLQVSGEIDCQSLYVLKPATWQDRVFDKAYTLPSLNDVETYISANKHLPGIKSEKEILENGYDVNEIDAALLEKIENLYLYVIKQQKEIDTLKNKLAEK